jgi:hypothetical protein
VYLVLPRHEHRAALLGAVDSLRDRWPRDFSLVTRGAAQPGRACV